jgi:hypothetical protein
LPRLIFRWLEDPLTVAASPFDHTGGCRIPWTWLSGERFRNCYSVGTTSWPIALSGPPPLTAAEVLFYRDSFRSEVFLTTSPAELLSFYPGVNTLRTRAHSCRAAHPWCGS